MAVKRIEGIRKRHRVGCRALGGGRCSCNPAFEASVPAGQRGRKIRRTFDSEEAAVAWRREELRAQEAGAWVPPSSVLLRDQAAAFIAGARSGAIRNRSGDEYKPSVVYGYENSLELHVLPLIGGRRIGDVTRTDIQRVVEAMLQPGLDGKGRDRPPLAPETVRNAILPLRAIFRRAVKDGVVATNPVSDVDLPAIRGRRDRFATPEEASKLIAAVDVGDRALWETAFFAGLRIGEIRALTWPDVDLARSEIRVSGNFCGKARRVVTTKSRAGDRTVPMPARLRDALAGHKIRTGAATGLVFTSTRGGVVAPSSVQDRADKAWTEAKLERVTPHEARHTYASMMAAARVPIEDLSEYMGHSSLNVTIKRYRHLYPEAHASAAAAMDALLARSDTGPRIDQIS